MTGAVAILLRMAQNNAWANGRLYGALQGMDRATFHAPRPGFFPSLKATLNHIHQVDLYYLDALEGAGLGRRVYDAPEIDDVAPLRAAQAAADARLIAFCAGLTPDTLARPCTTDRPDGPVIKTVTETTGALVLHLIQHQIHHRGQAHVQVQDAGVDPPQLDDFHLDYGRHADAERYFE